ELLVEKYRPLGTHPVYGSEGGHVYWIFLLQPLVLLDLPCLDELLYVLRHCYPNPWKLHKPFETALLVDLLYGLLQRAYHQRGLLVRPDLELRGREVLEAEHVPYLVEYLGDPLVVHALKIIAEESFYHFVFNIYR